MPPLDSEQSNFGIQGDVGASTQSFFQPSGITFAFAGLTSWVPTRGRSRPITPKTLDNSVAALTEAGTYQVANYSLALIHPMVFENLPVADYNTLFTFYLGVGRQLNQFSFTDETGAAHNVRFHSGDLKPADPDYLYVNISFELIEENYQ